jgi:hypothetical protein
MADLKTLDIASRELDSLIATGERIIAMAAQSESSIRGPALADVMAWASGSEHIIRTLAGEGSSYNASFLKARSLQNFGLMYVNQ